MRLKTILPGVVALALGLPASAASVSPVPAKMTEGANAFCSAKAVYRLTGADQADPDAVNALRQALKTADSNASVEIIIGEKGDDAVKAYEAKIPAGAEAYYLNITAPGKVIIAGADPAGTFYGVQTFLQLAGQGHCVPAVEIADRPAMAKRGVIEGFYGNPWSFQDRLSQFDFYGRNKMNIYVYGPKDDPFHHSRWFEPYPAAKAAEMAQLVKAADRNKVKFVWAMHPSNSIETKADRSKALDKFRRMYDLGVRNFAIFFDDISAKSVDAQIDYLNFLDREFVKKHSDVGNLIVCPTVYNKSWASGDYLHKMGTLLNPDIEIMWTGNSVCDMINVGDCEWFTSQTTRLPFIWLNYPVNDYGQHNLLMGPVVDNGTDVYDQVTAFCSNPMQYAEASKVALYSIADYTWNPIAYNADQAWERSVKYLMPEQADAFRDFCLSNVDVAPSTHGLRLYGETPDFKAISDKYSTLSDDAVAEYAAYFAKMKASAETLLALEETSPLVAEIKEFIQYFDYQSFRGQKAMEMAEALSSSEATKFINAYSAYKDATAAAGKLMSRNFEGSIQSVAPHTATLYVEPFIKSTVSTLITAFKNSGASYPSDLFPAQLLENGLYYIKVNGKYLTNVSGSGNPTLTATVDDVNPGRQMWVITLEPGTNRYSIKNEWDKRYVNELGNFGTNAYEDAWHTYTITRFEGSYAIQNGGSAGSNFWSSNGTRVNKGSNNDYHIDNFIFEIVPTDGDSEVNHPTIIGKTVYLFNEAGLVLTDQGVGNTALFQEMKTPANGKQLFSATIDSASGCVKFTNLATKQHLDEVGRCGSGTGYSATWNTYAVTEMDGLYSLRYTLDSKNYYGAKYWIPGETKIEYSADLTIYESYLFRIASREDVVSIEEIAGAESPAEGSEIYDLAGRKVTNPSKGFYIVNGQKKFIR